MENWFEHFKDRRFVPVFFITMLVIVGVPWVIGILVDTTNLDDYLKYWPVMAAVFAAWLMIAVMRAFAQTRARRRHRYKVSPLSRDELNKARSKLLNH